METQLTTPPPSPPVHEIGPLVITGKQVKSSRKSKMNEDIGGMAEK